MADDSNNKFPGESKIQWTETVHMLDLTANQIDLTLREGNDSMELLTNTFTSMADCLDTLEKSLEKTVYGGEKSINASHALTDCYAAKEKIHNAIIGLQFYDRLTQRFKYIRESLIVLAELIGDPIRQSIPEEWVALRQKIKSDYSTEQKKTIFNALMDGMDLDKVFELFED